MIILQNETVAYENIYINKKVLGKLKSLQISPHIREKFVTDVSSDNEIKNFMDFGVKGTNIHTIIILKIYDIFLQ